MSNLLQKASIITTPTAYNDGKLLSVKPVQYYGPELVTNGDFATDSDWTKGIGVTISNGKANWNNTGNNVGVTQNGIFTIGKTYKVVFTISNYVSGVVRVRFPFIENRIQANGTYTYYEVATTDGLYLQGETQFGNPQFSIDNVSVKEALNADFDFTRGSSATRVGSNGLIQTVASGLPRIDYSGGVGHILTEPERTNLVTYSEDFSNSAWGKARLSVSVNQVISPDGTLNADYIEQQSGNTTSGGFFDGIIFTAEKYTQSIFVKKKEKSFIALTENASSPSLRYTWFDIENGLIGTVNSGHTAKIENYGNGWYRCSITYTAINTGSGYSIFYYLSDRDGSTTVVGSGGLYAWGAQLEAGSYQTSYIKSNSGNATTRLTETLDNSGSADLINSTEGVLYAEFAALSSSDSSNRRLGITKNGTYEGVRLQMGSGNIAAVVFDGSTNQYSKQVSIDNSIFHKVVLKYKANDFAMWIDGFEYLTQSSGSTFIEDTLNDISFDYVGGNPFYGKTKCVAVFKEALSDLELECLSSWMSFADMGIALGYTIE